MDYSEKQIDNLLKGIFDGDINPLDLPHDLYFATAEYLKKGLYEGFGNSLSDIEFGGKDYKLLENLRENVYMFSGAKTFQQTKELSSMVADSESFRDFKAKALKVYDTYNVDYLKAEYNTAIGQAQNANSWLEFEKTKELFPLLRYSAVMDANTSTICAPLNGITLKVDDAFWNTHAPLNHFNCRCFLEKIDKYDDAKESSSTRVKQAANEVNEKMQDEFKMNPGKDQYVFSPEHPYFKVSKSEKAFAKENFGLPIPEVKVEPITKEEYEEAAKRKDYYYTDKKNHSYEERTIKSYTRDGYFVNAAIRENDILAVDTAFSRNLSKALNSLPDFKGEVYRGMPLKENLLESIKNNIGGEIEWNGFTSTTKNKEITEKFFGDKGMLFKIESKTGKDISNISAAKIDEQEVLFDKNSKFKILKVEGNTIHLQQIL